MPRSFTRTLKLKVRPESYAWLRARMWMCLSPCGDASTQPTPATNTRAADWNGTRTQAQSFVSFKARVTRNAFFKLTSRN